MRWCLCLFRIYEIEKAVDTPEKFMFPNFETVHWYAAKNIYDTIQGSYHAIMLLTKGAESSPTHITNYF